MTKLEDSKHSCCGCQNQIKRRELLTFEGDKEKKGHSQHDRVLDVVVQYGKRADSACEEKAEDDEGESDFEQ